MLAHAHLVLPFVVALRHAISLLGTLKSHDIHKLVTSYSHVAVLGI